MSILSRFIERSSDLSGEISVNEAKATRVRLPSMFCRLRSDRTIAREDRSPDVERTTNHGTKGAATRGAFSVLAALAIALTMLAAGCGGDENDEAVGRSAPAVDQIITINWGTEPPSLDPGLATDTTSANMPGAMSSDAANPNLPTLRV